MADPNRIPVIVGVGQVNDRPATPDQGLDSLGLMEAALRAADADAGGGWLTRLESLALVDQISWPQLGETTAPLAARLGAAPRITFKTPSAMGDSPILLLNQAANAIAAGEIEVAAVGGGEALRTAANLAAQAAGDQPHEHSAIRLASARRAQSYRRRYGLTGAVDIYPLYENAARAAYGQTLAEAQAESGEIWARFSEVAAANPGAWIRKAYSAAQIIETTADNRPIAFPYSKLMVANSSVNQGAGFIVASLACALAHGIAENRLIYIGRGAAAHEPDDFLARDRYDAFPGMQVSIRRALDLNGVTTADLDFVELYSCFPCVPKMARRVFGWPLEKPATVFGGLTFGGGPIGNYMSHAVVSMVLKLREGGRTGLLFANGGVATHNHTIVVSRDAAIAQALPADYDFQAEADAARGPIPRHVENYLGPGRVETYTVLYERDGRARFGVIVGRSPDGARFLAKIPAADSAGIAFLTDGAVEPVGSAGEAAMGPDGDVFWRTL